MHSNKQDFAYSFKNLGLDSPHVQGCWTNLDKYVTSDLLFTAFYGSNPAINPHSVTILKCIIFLYSVYSGTVKSSQPLQRGRSKLTTGQSTKWHLDGTVAKYSV